MRLSTVRDRELLSGELYLYKRCRPPSAREFLLPKLWKFGSWQLARGTRASIQVLRSHSLYDHARSCGISLRITE
eukprot:1178741-Prorocentrum_minimum.AAC.6